MFKVLESHTFAKSSHTPQNEYVLGKSIDPKLIGFIQSKRHHTFCTGKYANFPKKYSNRR